MKRVIFLFVAVLITFSVVHVFAESGAAVDFKNTKDWGKLDSATQDAWASAMNAGDKDRRMDCIVRVQPPFDPGDRAFLEDKGFVVRAAAGTLVRGHMKAGDMQDVAKLPFVLSIKIAVPN